VGRKITHGSYQHPNGGSDQYQYYNMRFLHFVSVIEWRKVSSKCDPYFLNQLQIGRGWKKNIVLTI
ncbi:MAG: hypothetical protein ACO3BD_05655, partial [Chitinophagaceae bacterium]